MSMPTRTARPPASRSHRAALLTEVASAAHRELAEATIPRDAAPEGVVGAPSVDADLWLLHVCYHETRDAELRRLLVEEYGDYAGWLARKMHRSGEPLEDLRQVALEALLLALDRFDPRRGCPFVAFASLTINGALQRHYRDFGWLMRVPRRVHQLAAPASRATDELMMENGRPPTLEEVAERVGVDVEELIESQEAVRARAATSLNALLVDDNDKPRDRFGTVDPACEQGDELLDLADDL
jgi:RNA polymerase sigma-B factor